MPTEHSRFSASGSGRLLACPGSFAFGERCDDGERRASIYAAEGTLAHAIAEACLLSGRDPGDFTGQTRTVDGHTFTIDEQFTEAVATYVALVRALRAMGYAVALERRVDPSIQWEGLDPSPIPLFGTSDVIAYHPATRTVQIVDLKFGAGVVVGVEGNSQLRYYGAGAAHRDVIEPICRQVGIRYEGIDRVAMTIVQPRAHHDDGPVRRAIETRESIREWSRTTLRDGILTAIADNGQTLVPGPWCRWCKALAHCPKPDELSRQQSRDLFAGAPAENVPAAAPTDTPDPAHLTDAQIGTILDRMDVLEPWIKAVRELAEERVRAGREVPGWKLVAGRRKRAWADDETEIRQALSGAGFPEEDYLRDDLRTPAQVEQRVGKPTYRALVEPHVVMSPGGVKLAPEGDPRRRVAQRSARDAFADAPADNRRGTTGDSDPLGLS